MKSVVITGGNSGLGFEVAKKVAKDKDYQIILACRNLEKGENAKNDIITETGNENVKVVKINTSSLDSVRNAAVEICDITDEIYALVNNAGVSAMGNAGTTADGFENVFETNYLGHFLLTMLLLPHIKEGRIYNISSDMHNPPGGVEWPGADKVAHAPEGDRSVYSYSKLAMIYFAHELSKREDLAGKNINVNAFNPGFMADTNFSKGGGKGRELIVKTTMPDRYGKLSTSSDALAKLVTDDEYKNITGEYFDRSTQTKRSSDLSYNDENAKELFEKSLEYVGLK